MRTPLVSSGPATLSDELAPFVQVPPPTIPPAAVELTMPLFVTVIAVLIVIVFEIVRLAVARNVCAPLTVDVAAMVPVPSIVFAAPVKRTVCVPPRFPVPLITVFPIIENVPAPAAVVTVTALLTVTFPKMIFAAGVMVELPVKVELLVAFNVRATETVKLLPNFRFAPATVVKIGAALKVGPKAYVELKLIVPVLVIDIVPSPWLSAALKLMMPVDTVITAHAELVPVDSVVVPFKFNVPEVM